MSIPKILHYCWFGGKPLPEESRRFIATWRRHCPNYEIVEWNENNFDLDICPYVRQAYDAGKYAFVSDVARLYALKQMGGIYLDTDVELLKSLNPFLHHLAFTGFEDRSHVTTGVIGSEKDGRFVSENLDAYFSRSFIKSDGSFDMTTNVAEITAYLLGKGLKLNNEYQEIPGIVTVYPRAYFCPKDSYAYGKTCITPDSHAIHYFAGSWQIRNTHEYQRLKKKYRIIPYFLRKKLILALMGEEKKGFFATLVRLAR